MVSFSFTSAFVDFGMTRLYGFAGGFPSGLRGHCCCLRLPLVGILLLAYFVHFCFVSFHMHGWMVARPPSTAASTNAGNKGSPPGTASRNDDQPRCARGRYVPAQLGLVEEFSTMEFSAIEFRLTRCNENVCNICFETCLVSTSSVASIGRFSFLGHGIHSSCFVRECLLF